MVQSELLPSGMAVEADLAVAEVVIETTHTTIVVIETTHTTIMAEVDLFLVVKILAEAAWPGHLKDLSSNITLATTMHMAALLYTRCRAWMVMQMPISSARPAGGLVTWQGSTVRVMMQEKLQELLFLLLADTTSECLANMIF